MVGDVKERHDQNNKNNGRSGVFSRRRCLNGVFTRGVVKANLHNQGFRLAVGFQGEMQQVASGYEKHHEGKDLKDYHSGNLHEHGVPCVASVRKNGGEAEEKKRCYPGTEDQNTDGFCRHQRDIPQGLCYCKETINRHCEDTGVRAVKEDEADFEEDPCVGEINRVKTELGSKQRRKERQSTAQISRGQRHDKPVWFCTKATPGGDQVNYHSISNHR